MAQIRFNVTQESAEKQAAAEQRELEARVQQKNIERDRKLALLHRTTKRNKIIVISVFILLALSLLVFGVYNTFFKNQISRSDIEGMISQQVASFDTDGIQGVIYDNLDDMFYSMSSKNENIETYALDKSTIRINKVYKMSTSTVAVEFTVDGYVKEIDVSEKNGNGEVQTTTGEVYTPVYNFMIFVDTNDRGGYTISSELLFLGFEHLDSTTALKSKLLVFNDGENDFELVEENTLNSVRVKVDRILSDIYEGKDVGVDYSSDRIFDTSYTYLGLEEFAMYNRANLAGFNAVCSYSLSTPEGITITTKAYLTIQEESNSWKITAIF